MGNASNVRGNKGYGQGGKVFERNGLTQFHCSAIGEYLKYVNFANER